MVVRAALLLALSVGLCFLAACGGEDTAEGQGGSTLSGDADLVVYSGREEELVGPLFELFEERSGVDVEVRYGDSAELAATIAEEGGNSPADVFFAQDPGSLGAVEGEGLLAELAPETLSRVPARFRDPDGHWTGTSGRARVIAYNTEEVPEDEVPDSVFDVTDPKWKGRIGFPPTNASFQVFVSAMRISIGEERTREWLEALRDNDPKLYENNIQTVEAIAAGEVDIGLVNHYYLYLLREETPDMPVENHYLADGDPGALVSVAGAAVLESAEHPDAAQDFVAFLLSDEGQHFYTERAEEAEYPLVDGIPPRKGLPPLESLHGPEIELDAVGAELERTLELLNEVGFTT